MWQYVNKFYLGLALLVGALLLRCNLPLGLIFVFGLIVGVANASLYFDSWVGMTNQKEGRSFSWRPWWKGPYSR